MTPEEKTDLKRFIKDSISEEVNKLQGILNAEIYRRIEHQHQTHQLNYVSVQQLIDILNERLSRFENILNDSTNQ